MTTLVIILVALPMAVFLQVSHGVTTTNCTIVGQTTTCSPSAGGGGATFGGTQRKVFEANGYWWIFWETGSQIDYQSCAASTVTSCAVQSSWSAAALFTKQGWTATSGSGQGFSAWLVVSGSTYYLVYADAPTNGGGTFYWGIASLGSGTVSFAGLPEDQSFSLLASHVGAGTASISVTVDGNNYIWIAVFTHNGNAYYEDVFECPVNIITTPTGCESATWDTTTSIQATAQTTGLLDAPEVLPVTNGGTYYVALVFVDASSSGTGGILYTLMSPSGQASSNSILWQSSCGSSSTVSSPAEGVGCSTSANMTPSTTSISSGGGVGGYFYSAVSSGSTIYYAAEISQAAIYYFTYTEGAAAYTTDISFIPGLTANVYFTLSYSGTNLVFTYQPQNTDNVVFTWATMASVAAGTAPSGWNGNTNLAVNTEWTQPEPSASFSSFTVGSYNLIGVIWDTGVTNPTPNTNRIRFAVESMGASGVVTFPITVTLSLNEYNTPGSANSHISTTNFFPISYTTSTGVTNTAYYTSSNGAVLTIPNILSYSNFLIAEQSSASTGAERWCLVIGGNCPNGQVSTFTGVGASDGLTLQYYYYDQLLEPNLFAIATPAVYSLWATTTSTFATSNYESTNTGFPASDSGGNFQLYPNPDIATPYAIPRVSLYTSANGYDEFTQWVRARDSTPACTGLITYPVPGSSSTCAPSVSFGIPYGTTTSATANVLTDTSANWQWGQWVGYKLEYNTGPAAGEFLLISASTATTITTSSSFNPPPTPGGGDSFSLVEPSVTVNNPSGVTLPSVGPAVTTYVPLVITNSQTAATASGFQQMITVDSNTFSQYEAANLRNVEFFNGATGAVFNSWLESGASSTSSSTTYWVNLGTSTVPAGTVGAVLASGVTTSASAKVLTDTSVAWTAQQYVNDYLYYTSGPAAGQWLPIIANAATTLTTENAAAPYIGALFAPAPTAGGGDHFEIISVIPGSLTIYMGFVAPANNLFSSAGPVGEAPQLSPVYAQYDDGAVVFPSFYSNFAGTSLPAAFTGDLPASGTTTAGTTNTVLQDTSVSLIPSALVGETLTYTSGPAAGQTRQISANTATSITVATAFLPAPDTSGDTFQVYGATIYDNNGITLTTPSTSTWGGIVTSSGVSTATPMTLDADVISVYGVAAGIGVNSAYTGTTTAGSTTTVLQDTAASWTANSFTTGILTYTSGADSGQSRVITSNTATSITVGVAFSSAPAAGTSFTVSGAGYSLNFWGGSVSSGTMPGSQTNTGNPNLAIEPGIDGMSWVSNTLQYYYRDYSLTGGTLATYTLTPNAYLALGMWSSSASSQISVQWLRLRTNAPQGIMPSVVVGPATTAALDPATITEYVPVTITNNQIYNTPVFDQVDVNVTSSYYFKYENALLQNVEFFTDSNPLTTAGSLVPSWLESGNSNTAPNSVFWVRLPNGLVPFTGTTTSTTNLVLTDTNANWAAGEFVGETLTYTSGPAMGETRVITANTANTITVGTAFNPAPTPGGGDAFQVIASTTLYMGFASVPTNLFSADNWYNGVNGYVGEAPTLSSSYGLYDNGANVFNFYDNFAGTTLSANWQTDSQFGTDLGAQALIGKLTTNTCGANLPTATAALGINTPAGEAFDASGDLWVVDRCDNRILEYSAASLSSNNPTPILVLGQNSFTIGLPNEGAPVSAAGLFDPTGIAFDSSGNLWVADSGNNRVLEFTTPFATGEAASKVVGQAAFNTNGAATSATQLSNPTTVAFNSGNLWVVDTNNNRILEFPSAATLPATGGTATIVVGQTAMGNSGSATSITGVWGPTDIAFDSSGDLWVADTFNNRITGYTAAAITASDPSANWLIGQAAMANGGADASQPLPSIGSSGFLNPTSVAFDSSGDLWVADGVNNRILEFPLLQLNSFTLSTGTTTSATANVLTDTNQNWGVNIFSGEILYYTSGPAAGLYLPIASNTAHTITTTGSFNPAPTAAGGNTFTVMPAATVVQGQSAFTSSAYNGGSNYVNAAGLNTPAVLTFYSGNLWVTDMQNNRVLEFASASLTTSGSSASIVVGQAAMTVGIDTQDPASAISLNDPTAQVFDSSGNLWVADTGNNRILEFTAPYYTGETASLVLGQSTFTSTASGSGPTNLNGPTSLAFDSHGNLWVSDSGNNRIVEFTYPFTSGEAASIVVGQTGFGMTGTGTTSTTLKDPQAIAFDSSGDLWVADSLNNRVIMYPAASLGSDGPAATIAEGQASLTTGTAGLGPYALHDPMGIAFDSYGNLWVADTLNNRVVEFLYSSLSSSGGGIGLVIGQTNFSNGFTNEGGNVNGNGLNYPTAVTFDKWGELWVSDTGNNRVIQYIPSYDATFTNGEGENNYEGPSSINIGVPDRYDYNSISTVELAIPRGLAVDPLDDLWIADSGNNRVWASAAGTAGGSLTPTGTVLAPTVEVYNGVSLRYTSTTMGIVSEATVNPQTNILEFDSYFSSVNSGVTWDTYTTPAPNTPAPTQAGYLYGVTPSTLSAQNGAILDNKGTVGNYLLNTLTLPLQTPTTIYFEPYNSWCGCQPDGLEPFPASTYVYVQTSNIATSVQSWWVLRNTTVTVTQALSGQPGERWAAQPNYLTLTINQPYEIVPAVLYYHQYEEDFQVIPAGLVTTLDSGVSMTLEGTQYGQQSTPIATFYAGSTSLDEYVDAGTTIVFPGTAVGSPFGVRWENSNNQSQTAIINGPLTCTSLCTAYYYKQYEQYLQFSTSDGSVPPSGQNLLYTYTSFGKTYTKPIPTTTGTVWDDALTTSSATPLVAGGGNSEAVGTSSSASPLVLTDNTGGWTAGAFVGDYLEYTTGPAAGQAGLITANTATTITVAVAFSPPPTPGGGDNFQVLQLYERWVIALPTQTITGAFQLTDPLVYYHQFVQAVSNYKTSDYNQIPGGYGTPKLSLTINGTKNNIVLNWSGTVSDYWADAGVTDNATATIPGASGQRWVPEIGTWKINGTNTISPFHSGIIGPYGSNESIVFDNQWEVLYESNPMNTPGNSPVIISSQTPIQHELGRPYVVQTIGVLDWQTTPLYVQAASSNSSLVFSDWTRSGNACFNVLGVCEALTTSSASEALLTGTSTITANFELENGITFIQTGIPNGAATWTALIYYNNNLYKVGASSSSALSIVLPNGAYTYVLPSPVLNPAGNTKYYPIAGEGSGNFTLTHAAPSQSIQVTFNVLFKLSAVTDPIGYTPITVTGTNGTGPGQPFGPSTVTNAGVWLQPSSTATLTEACGCGSKFYGWYGNITTLTSTVNIPAMDDPIREVAEFNVPLSLQIVPSIETGYTGENLTATVYVYGGAGTVTVTTGALPPGISVLYSLPASPLQSSVNFPADANNKPFGEPVTMLVEISAHTTLYGALNFTVNAIDTGNAMTTPPIPIDTAMGTYTLDIITPKAIIAGYTNTPYAITTPDQTAMFEEVGHWYIFYYTGSALVYTFSNDSTGDVWSQPVAVPSNAQTQGIQGDSFAVTASMVNVGFGNGTLLPEVFYILTPSSNGVPTLNQFQPSVSNFWYDYGYIAHNGTIVWDSPTTPFTQAIASPTCQFGCPAGVQREYPDGKPALTVDNATDRLWVSFPVLYQYNISPPCASAGLDCLQWHLQAWDAQIPTLVPSGPPSPLWSSGAEDIGDIQATSSAQATTVTEQLLVVNGPSDNPHADLLIVWAGNSASHPKIYAWPEGAETPENDTCTAPSALYGQQSQATVSGTNVYFAGLAVVGPNQLGVEFYSYSYAQAQQGCSPSPYSAAQDVAPGSNIPMSELVDNSWHVTVSFSNDNLLVGYGVNNELTFAVGSESAGSWTWFVPPSGIEGFSDVVGGLSSSAGASGTQVAMCWVDTIAGTNSQYTIDFVLA